MLIYLGKGRLPWQGVDASNKRQRYEKSCEIKMTTKSKDLCSGLPVEYQLLVDYVKKLTFEERPNYDLLGDMFKEVMAAEDMDNDGVFDWIEE